VQLANSFGIDAMYCDNPNNLKYTIKQFLTHKGPILCEFDIVSDICLPLVGPGNALDDMLLPNESVSPRSEEHTSELQSHSDLVFRLLLEKKKTKDIRDT